MARISSTGTCGFCQATFSKAGMTRHLPTCKSRPVSPATPSSGARSRRAKTLHLVVSGRYSPEYWLHLAASSDATLDDLDALLRAEWLECCGHLSAFRIGGRSYSGNRFASEWEDDSTGMGAKLGKILTPGLTFSYEYDFGTTTELTLKVAPDSPDLPGIDPITILARNDPPDIPCNGCGRSATQVCTECVWKGGGWLCSSCLRKHECGDEMCLPVVNSPRVGMCGYAG